MKSARLGNEDAFQKGVKVEDGPAKGNLEIIVSNEVAQLEGTVTDSEKNQPVTAVQIRLRGDPENEYSLSARIRQAPTRTAITSSKMSCPGKYKVTAKIPSPSEGAPAIKS